MAFYQWLDLNKNEFQMNLINACTFFHKVYFKKLTLKGKIFISEDVLMLKLYPLFYVVIYTHIYMLKKI